jgi:riboflavin kinase/FMN adenylyltransferase
MLVYKDINSINIKNPIVTVGTFDGVHLGHQHIFNKLLEIAQNVDGEPVVITLWPHPRMIVHPGGTDIMILNTLEEKIELIKLQGIKHLIVLPFNNEFSQLSSTQFIDEYLHQKIGIKGLIMGYDHRFGKDRIGDSEELTCFAKKYGFFIENVGAFCFEGKKISSTKIRNALFDGNIELANSMLSKSYSISGTIEEGEKLGRKLGFPTANLKPDYNYKLIPRDGVYAVKVEVEGVLFSGMLNIGHRPTINKGNENRSIEVHLIDFEGNLYGKKINLLFFKRIRDEVKYNNLEELKNQLKLDKSEIIRYFKI